MKRSTKSIFFNIIRLILSALFIFSGFVKSVDPVGTVIKIKEYMLSFGLDYFLSVSSTIAIIMCALEFMIGLLLLCNIFKKTTSYLVLIFMSFFTLLTLYIYIANPVSDCGCFGDAIKLSNGATLLKNIAFIILAIIYFTSRKDAPKIDSIKQQIIFCMLATVSIAVPVYSLLWHPAIEFLPYKVGVNIPQAMSIPKDAPQSEYETILVYKDKTNNKIQEFAIEDTTWYDTMRWEYVDTKNITIKKGYEPTISNFSILDDNGIDISEDILSDTSFTFMITLFNNTLSQREYEKLSALSSFAENNGIKLVLVTHNDLQNYKDHFMQHNINGVLYNIDQTLLKSIIRTGSHNGVIVLKNGVIMAKWNLSHVPSINNQDEMLSSIEDNNNKYIIFICLIIMYIALVVSYRFINKK